MNLASFFKPLIKTDYKLSPSLQYFEAYLEILECK